MTTTFRPFGASLEATGLRIAVVVARFNHLICVRLLEGCADELARYGVAADDIHAWPTNCMAARSIAKRAKSPDCTRSSS